MVRRFRKDEFALQESFRSGRESDVDNDRLRQLLESDPQRTARELAQDLIVHYATITRHLHRLGKAHKLAQWVIHDLTERDRQRRGGHSVAVIEAHRQLAEVHHHRR
ncbi:unnamed protein product [Heligmosomoides polygyrus]|uniref:HTH_48 domain-containing protein n=1 Tax=Heligmosomoides polygyrus TaxID=6339 RepID=A0A3P7ZP15_HELPZ|nr:unnamed protein product [Heligmosomoides polygyrus]